MGFNARVIAELNIPSRTITSRSRMPLPITKALYRVRKNITLSKSDRPAHAIAAAVSPSYYNQRKSLQKTYFDPWYKNELSHTREWTTWGITTYFFSDTECEHPAKLDKTGITPPRTPAWRLARMAPFRENDSRKYIHLLRGLKEEAYSCGGIWYHGGEYEKSFDAATLAVQCMDADAT